MNGENGPAERREARVSLSEIKDILAKEPFNPEDLIRLLEKEFPETFKEDAGVWEKYTLGQHTLMVMQQFEKYFGHKELPGEVDKGLFRLILALHDIGKPEAIENGGKHLQHQYTQKIIRQFFGRLGLDEESTKLALVLTSGDPIGKYFTRRADISETQETIEALAKEAQMKVEEFFELLLVFYKSDAGSYTENAGGFASLDHLFVFDEVRRELKFAPPVQQAIDQLDFLR